VFADRAPGFEPGARGAAAAPGGLNSPAGRAGLQSPLLSDLLAGTPGARANVPAPLAAGLPGTPTGEPAWTGAVPDRPPAPVPDSGGGDSSAAPLAPAGEAGPGVPDPAGAGVLTALAPPDLSALERGLLQLLEQLGQAGQDVTGAAGGYRLAPWVVAGASAAVACEIARRQLRQSTGADDGRVPGPPPAPSPAG
jgi:hypothetical protein